MPPIFVSQKIDGTWDVIDGQQRLSTILQYIDTDLLSNRHAVVHGDNIRIEISDFDSTFEIIMEIMIQLFGTSLRCGNE